MPEPEFDDGRKVKPEGRYTVDGAVGKFNSFRYEYDFSDSWEHVIKVEKVLPPQVADGVIVMFELGPVSITLRNEKEKNLLKWLSYFSLFTQYSITNYSFIN